MIEFMLDSDICIYVMKRRSSSLMEKFESMSGKLCISSIGLGELLFGAEKSQRRDENWRVVESFVARLATLPYGEKAAAHFAHLRAALERAGTPCGLSDVQIAAHARSEGLTVVTNNRRGFDRMPGLLVENWM